MIWNALLLALREIRRNLMRSFLTILGIVIGVSAVITMVTLGNGATRAVSDQIASLGSNLLIIRPGQHLGPGRDSAGAAAFKVADVEALKTQVSGLAAVVPVTNKSVTLVAMARNWSTGVTGTTRDWFATGKWQIASGRIFNEAEERAGAAACVIGETVRRELFGSQDPLGQQIRVKQFSCEVIGLLASKGQSTMGNDQDDLLVMPLRTVQRRLTGSIDVASLMISVRDDASMDIAKDQVSWLMRERRHIGAGDNDDFSVMDTRQIAETLSGTTKVMTGLLGAVAAVSLLVGGIGIMNIMLVSVTERTREIGIRLAIGALEREVLLQFLIEAVVLASLGGIVGIVLATLASIGGAALMHVPYLFNPAINLLSFGFSAAIGVVFGYVPARRAARLDPIEALRHE
ncbi:MAG: ABC transporter permease [Zoogloea oleivorans]|jgi:putative ABC transport system permease protein|uniref:ABC transporter permease n=1 Tax=Zoogloea oleivorans TaxID=1552750 RepID=UPI002A37074F|nr:ABC transporter permease [Zoogloea oleivorans]MDY0037665.1 ABC transporter permease [Zoogloea oleivorans]